MTLGSIIAYVIVPVTLFLLGALYGGIRLTIRFARYLAHSEHAQTSIAETNERIADRLDAYMERTDKTVGDLDKRLAVVEYAVEESKDLNGRNRVARATGHPATS